MLSRRAEHLEGSEPEIVVHRKTGFVLDSIDRMAEAVKAIHLFETCDCRSHVKKKICQYGQKILPALSVDGG
jgi:hypothetical protein